MTNKQSETPKSKPPIASEPYRTGPEVARHFRVSEATVRSWRKHGCPAYPRGYRLILYRISEVDSWLKTREGREELLPV
jgi:hypothetical protein